MLVNRLMLVTGLTAAMPIAAFLRRDLPLFFETFEAYKEGASSTAAGANEGASSAAAGAFAALSDVPSTALVALAPDAAVSVSGAASSGSTAASASPAGAAFAAALTDTVDQLPTPTMDLIKVSPRKTTRTDV